MNIKKTRHILLFSLTLLLFSTQGYSQRKDIDFGLLLGTIQYNGDVNMTRAYTSPLPAIALIFRKNYNPHYSLRFDATFGRLACKDENFHNNYQQNRDYSFDDSRVMELTGMVEFNFFEVTTNKKEKNFSPYVVFGLGAMYIENVKWYEHFNIPMGLGLKYKLTSRMELRGEWVFRRTFTDQLDQLAYRANDGFLHYKQISFSKTKDWFSVLGISLLFNFSDEKIPCPIYEQRKYDGNKKHKH